MYWGPRSKARAMATRCFCPPDSFSPRSPTRSVHFTFPAKTKSMFAALAASSTCSSVASRLPYLTFSSRVTSKSTGSCPTMPTCLRHHATLRSRRFWPPTWMEPACGS
mmetsp:Transcript_139877/g.198101  ORF Transcript_139877/g.198101 Transcript_139877/m.198101 type:complete len:108 (-) Transcript_139877:132-455(-)